MFNKNKKGNVLDWFYIMALLFMFFITIIVSVIIVTKVDLSGIFDDTPTAAAALNSSKNTLLNFDNLLLFVIIGLSISVLLSSLVVANHPGYFIASFIFLCIAVIVASIMSNTFWQFINVSTISPTADQFPKMQFLFNNLPMYIAFMGSASLILAYVSFRRSDGF